ncbi:MAG: conserved repeat domain protein [Planctomycetaceae bacterium]|nr:conserved repeat domain protein [Planctomycetaceae bacterium]
MKKFSWLQFVGQFLGVRRISGRIRELSTQGVQGLANQLRCVQAPKARRDSGLARRPASWQVFAEQLETRTLLTFVIVPTFDTTITSDPNAATIISSINRTIAAYENSFTNNNTVHITFQEGGGLGGSLTFLNNVTYTSYHAALIADASGADDLLALSTLPSGANQPIVGTASDTSLNIPTALERTLGYSGGQVAMDGQITLNVGLMNLDRTGVQDSSKYDLMAVAAHEIDEVLGLGSGLDGSNNGDPISGTTIEAADLYRYASAGVRSFNTSVNSAAFFSIDGGTTMMARFNQTAGGDFGDWYSAFGGQIPQVQDAFGTPGSTPNLNAELRRADVIGYTRVPQVTLSLTAPGSQTAVPGVSTPFNLGSINNGNGPFGVTVNWGDGSANTTFFVNGTGSLGTKNHTYPTGLTYTPSITVTDFTSQTGSTTFNVGTTGTVQFKTSTKSVTEGGGSQTVVVSLTGTGVLQNNVTVPIIATNGTATSGSDYSLVTTLVTFPAGTDLSTNPTQNVTFSLPNDTLIEGSENFTLSLGTITATGDKITAGTTTSNVVTIADNDSATVSISNGASVTEGGATSPITATLHVTTDGVAGGSATLAAGMTANLPGNSDYSSLAASFPAGSGNNATANLTVSATQDGIVEGTEVFTNQILTVTGAATVSGVGQTITVSDDDIATVSIAKIQDGAETNTPTHGTFRVTQTAISSTDTVVNYSVAGTATAGPGNDYALLTGTVTILAGQTTADIDIAVLNDALIEGTETVILTLTSLGSHNPSITLNPVSASLTATVNITDDDTGTVSIAKITDGVDASTPTNGKFRVTQTAVSATDTVVNYTISGTATPGADYTTLSGSVTILAGQLTADIDVAVLNDGLVEGTETVTLVLSSFGSHDPDITLNPLPSNLTATVNITDNDTATVSVSKITDGAEGITPTNGKFRVTQTAASTTDTVVNYTIDGTATAGAGNDYTTLSGTVTILAGQTTADIDVAVLNDALVEGTETVDLTLTGFGNHNAHISLSASQPNLAATVNITDDDAATVSIAKITDGAEASTPTNGKFRVTQSMVSVTDTIVNYSISGTATAGPGNDYGTLAGTVTIPAGQTTADISVKVFNDAVVEGTETVILTLSGFGGLNPGVTLDPVPSKQTATVSITDDDLATVSIVKTTNAAEGAPPTNGKFRVMQTMVSATDTIVNYTITGSATPGAGNDYTALPGSIIIPAGQTTADVDVEILDDAVVEGLETIILTLSSLGSHSPGVTLHPAPANLTGTVSIVDDDTATISIAKVTNGAEANTPTDGLFQVTQSAPSSTDTVVNYSISGTATPGSDYTPLTGTVTILAGQTTADIDVPVLNDTLVEAPETVVATLASLGSHDPAITLDAAPANLTATVSIIDDDTATVSIAKITDGAELSTPTDGTFRVTLSTASSVDTVVNYSVAGTATPGAGNDYTPLTGTVTILAGQTTADIDVPVIDDALVESTETVVLTLTGFGNHAPGITLDPVSANQTATVNITDNDTATVSIAKITDGVEANAPANGKFRVTQTAASSTDTVVNYTIGGTATPGAGNDYTPLTGTVTILAGQTSADIDVSVLNDSVVEAPESVVLTLSDLGSHDPDITLDAAPANQVATVTITDDDAATVSIVKIADGAEGNSPADGTFRVTQTAVSATDTVVNYAISGTATPGAGNDYTTLTGTVTIPAGQTTVDIDVPVLDDALVEGTQTVVLTLNGFGSHAPGVTLDPVSTNRTATVDIADDDTATVSIAKITDGAEANTPTNGKFRVTQTAISETDTVVNYAITGTATPGAGNDYTTLTGIVTIPAGQTTADIDVTVLNDALVEATETVGLTLTGFGSHASGVTLDPLFSNQTATISITDDDTATVSIAKITDGAEANTPTNGKFRVTQTAASTTNTVVNYSISGTATLGAGNDYSPLTGIVTILAGQTSADIDVTVLNDTIVEGTETVNLTLSNLGSHDPDITLDPATANQTATVNIADDDTATVSIAKITDGAESAASTDGTFRVTQTAISATDTVLTYAIAGTATSGAGSDYLPLTGTVTIPAGQTTADIDVAVLNDTLVEGTETVVLTLTGFTSSTAGITLNAVPAKQTASVNITDDDTATVSIVKITDGSETNTPTNGTFRVTQTAVSSADTVVNYSISGTATPGAGNDYTTLTGNVTIPAGQTTADINVAVLNDSLVEGTETVGLTLAGFGSHNSGITLNAVPGQLTATVSITDNDTATVSIAKITDGIEGTTPTNGKFRVTQTAASATDTVVNYTISGTAAPGAGNDYTTLSGTVTIPAGQTTADINVAVLDDAIVEGTETVNLTLSSLGSHDPKISLDAAPANQTATVNINDDDTATVSVVKIADGAETDTPTDGTFRVTQTAVSTTDTIVNYTISGTATPGAGNDYTTLSGTVTIPAGQTTADIDVTVLNDAFVEGTETVVLLLSGIGNQTPAITLDPVSSNQTATVNITDNDVLTIVTPAAVTVPENTSVSTAFVNVDANNVPGSALTFSLSGPDASRLTINSATGEIAFLVSPNFEAPIDQGADNVYHVTVGVTDDLVPSHSTSQSLAISVSNVNEAPTAIALSTGTVAENLPVGTAIGNLTTTDPDSGDTFVYSLVDGDGAADNALFQVAGGTLQTNSVFDFEARSSYSVRVRSTDAGGLSTDKVFTILISDVNDPPIVTLTSSTTSTLTGRAVAVDSGALFQDQDSTNFKNNRVVTTIKDGLQTPDQLHLVANGKGTDKLKVASGLLKLGKTTLGTVTGGKSGQPMVLTFTTDVSAGLVQRVVRSIAFQTHKANSGVRKIEIQAFDGANSSVPPASKTVVVGTP